MAHCDSPWPALELDAKVIGEGAGLAAEDGAGLDIGGVEDFVVFHTDLALDEIIHFEEEQDGSEADEQGFPATKDARFLRLWPPRRDDGGRMGAHRHYWLPKPQQFHVLSPDW